MGRVRNAQATPRRARPPGDAWSARSTPAELGYLRSVEAMNRNLVALARRGEAARQRRRRLRRRCTARGRGTARRSGSASVVAGTDAVAVDAVAAAVMGFDPLRDRLPRTMPRTPGSGVADLDADRGRRRPDRLGPPPVRPALEPRDPAALGPARRAARPTSGPHFADARRRAAERAAPTMSRPPGRTAVAVVVAVDRRAGDGRRAASRGSPTRSTAAGEVIAGRRLARRDGRRGRARRSRRPGAPTARRAGSPPNSGATACGRPTPRSSRSRRPQMVPRPGLARRAARPARRDRGGGVGGPIEPAAGSRPTDRAVVPAPLRRTTSARSPDPAASSRRATTPLYRRDRLEGLESLWARRLLGGRGPPGPPRPGRVAGDGRRRGRRRSTGGAGLARLLRQRFAHARRYGASRAVGSGRRGAAGADRPRRRRSRPCCCAGSSPRCAARGEPLGPWLPALPAPGAPAGGLGAGRGGGIWAGAADRGRRAEAASTVERAIGPDRSQTRTGGAGMDADGRAVGFLVVGDGVPRGPAGRGGDGRRGAAGWSPSTTATRRWPSAVASQHGVGRGRRLRRRRSARDGVDAVVDRHARTPTTAEAGPAGAGGGQARPLREAAGGPARGGPAARACGPTSCGSGWPPA